MTNSELRLTWDSECPAPYESMWSLAAKVQALNFCEKAKCEPCCCRQSLLTALCPVTFMARARGQQAAKEVNESDQADARTDVGIGVQRSLHTTDQGRVIGLCRHWDGLRSTSGMRRVADGGGIQQPDDSFLH